jgi:ribosomal protein L11 methylase PrmA
LAPILRKHWLATGGICDGGACRRLRTHNGVRGHCSWADKGAAPRCNTAQLRNLVRLCERLPSALNQQVNAILKAKGTIADTDLVQTYEKHLSPTRLTERIDLVGSQVKGEIDQVMAMIDAAAGSASSYSESLAGATEQIVRSKDRDGLRTIVSYRRRRRWKFQPST